MKKLAIVSLVLTLTACGNSSTPIQESAEQIESSSTARLRGAEPQDLGKSLKPASVSKLGAIQALGNGGYKNNYEVLGQKSYPDGKGGTFTVHWLVVRDSDAYTDSGFHFAGLAEYGSGFCNIYLNQYYSPSGYFINNPNLAGSTAQTTDVMAHEFGHCVDRWALNYNHNGVYYGEGAKYGDYFKTPVEGYAQGFSENYKKFCGDHYAKYNFITDATPYTVGSMTTCSVTRNGVKTTTDLTSLYSVPNSNIQTMRQSNFRCGGFDNAEPTCRASETKENQPQFGSYPY